MPFLIVLLVNWMANNIKKFGERYVIEYFFDPVGRNDNGVDLPEM